ncbi:ABC transporter permease [Rubellimicrobium arenae]|uniref:ABC transporter permease n=1 Tax=Rubellimicrobium arenae TaxID=2817372 RepID=UPI001B3121C7|nr:ABC transporter permease subunit [Rubellimicrobium arenae]
MKIGTFVRATGIGLILLFAVAPILVLILAAFDEGRFFRFPPRGLSMRWFIAAFESAEYRASVTRSVVVASLATVISVGLGGLAALGLVRGRPPGQAYLEALILAPLALPLVVWAIAFLQVLSYSGLGGTLFGLILAHVIITLPIAMRVILATFTRIDPDLEAAARSLGATPVRAFLRTTLPLARGGIAGAAALSFLVSFNDVVVSTFVAGAGWVTFPVRLYAQLRGEGIDPITLAIGAMIVGVIIVGAIATELWPRRRGR